MALKGKKKVKKWSKNGKQMKSGIENRWEQTDREDSE